MLLGKKVNKTPVFSMMNKKVVQCYDDEMYLF